MRYLIPEYNVLEIWASENLAEFLPRLFNAMIAVIAFFLLYKLIVLCFLPFYRGKSNHRKTVLSLTQNLIKYVLIVIGFFVVLGALGVPLGAALAGGGFFALVIGFGAQNLISDVLSGLFIVFENSFQVGDMIMVEGNSSCPEGFRGTVLNIGIRTTKLRHDNGNIQIINNSEMRIIVNQSQTRTEVRQHIMLDYSEDLVATEKIIIAAVRKWHETLPAIEGQAEYKGPVEFNERGIMLRIMAKCEEHDRFQLSRDMNREIKLLFDKHKIKFGVPQREVRTKTK